MHAMPADQWHTDSLDQCLYVSSYSSRQTGHVLLMLAQHELSEKSQSTGCKSPFSTQLDTGQLRGGFMLGVPGLRSWWGWATQACDTRLIMHKDAPYDGSWHQPRQIAPVAVLLVYFS